MPSFLSSLIGGIWGYVAAAVIAAALAVGATHFIDANAYGKTISDMKAAEANQKAANATQALSQLQLFISNMHNATTDYQGDLSAINARFAAIEGEFKNATRKPLPVDCKPDAGRVRLLSAAIAAANAKAIAP